MKRERGPDGKWPITPGLADAQRRYMAVTGVRISQAEVQQLQARLDAGDWPDEAASWVYDFFQLHKGAMHHSKQFESGSQAINAYDEYIKANDKRGFYKDLD